MLNYSKILVFDFETTGLRPQIDQIIEVGAQLYKKIDNDYQLVDELNLLVKTDFALPAKIVEITNITDQMLAKDGVSEEEAFHRLTSMYDDNTLLVAYNIAFDLGFLNALWRKYHSVRYEIPNDILDVMAVYKDRHQYPHRLDNAVGTYNVMVKNTHRALDDVKATFIALTKMNDEKQNIYKYVNVLGFNPKYGYSGPYLRKVKTIAQRGGNREIERLE